MNKKMLRIPSIMILVFIICIYTIIPISSAEGAQKIDGEIDHNTKTLYSGVQQTYYSLSSSSKYGLQKFWTVEFDPAQPDLYFDVLGGGTYANQLKTVGATIEKFNGLDNGKTAIAAVNGDLWMVTYAHARVEGKGTEYGGYSDAVVTKSFTLPRGFNMYNGEIITTSHMKQETPYEGDFYSFAITPDGIPVLGKPSLKINITDTNANKTVLADGLNRLPANNALVMYSDVSSVSNYSLNDAYEIIIDCDYDYVVAHDAIIQGKITNITKPGDTKQAMQQNRIILTARGTSIQALGSMNIGDNIEIECTINDSMGNSEIWRMVENAVGGHIPVIIDGQSTNKSDQTKYPMSVLGIKENGNVVMLCNDGRQSEYSIGIKIADLDELCVDLGIKTAFILDGGGSATLVSLDQGEYTLVNRPCDTGNTPRTVVNSVVLSYGEPREQKEPTVEHTFTEEASLLYVESGRNIEYKTEDNSLHAYATDTRDPYFYLNFDSVSANEYKYLTVTLKPDTEIERDFKLGMFLSSGDKYQSSDNSTYRGISYKNVKEYQTLVVDLSKMSAWGGQIHSIRFDLFDDYDKAVVGEGIYLKSVKLHKTMEEAENYIKLMDESNSETDEIVSDTQIEALTPSNSCGCSSMAAVLPVFLAGGLAVIVFAKKR